MSRPLSSLALVCFLLAAGTGAPACPTCDLPATSAPVADPVPKAVFEAGHLEKSI